MNFGCWVNLVRSWTGFWFCCFYDNNSPLVSVSSSLTLRLGCVFLFLFFQCPWNILSFCAFLCNYATLEIFLRNVAYSPVVAFYCLLFSVCCLILGRGQEVSLLSWSSSVLVQLCVPGSSWWGFLMILSLFLMTAKLCLVSLGGLFQEFPDSRAHSSTHQQ